MDEDYVTYKQAKNLKDLGFDWKCFGYYTYLGNLGFDHPVEDILNSKIIYENFNDTQISELYSIDCSAPTLSQAQKWLREVKGIIICIEPGFYKNKRPLMGYDYHLFNKDDGWYSYIESKTVYDTYEEALSAGIIKVLELLKEQENG